MFGELGQEAGLLPLNGADKVPEVHAVEFLKLGRPVAQECPEASSVLGKLQNFRGDRIHKSSPCLVT